MAAESTDNKRARLGDFELKKKLGQGGMGSVYLAHQLSLDRPCAVKVLSKELASRSGFVDRFLREARAMAKLNHPHIVSCYFVGEEKGHHYVAMELVDGMSLQVWLERLGTIPVGDALLVAIVAGEALQFAHEKNMIHRDVKPDNILVSQNGLIKIADLGLAKAIDEIDMSLTQSGTGLGTPHYMPPEQARNAKHVDRRCDVYALGSTLYHMLTGKLPFQGESLLDLITNKEKGHFTPARQINKAVPDRLSLIIDRAMAKDPKSRYQSCAEFVHDLEALGLAHESLSFIDTSDKVILRRAAGLATTIGARTTTDPLKRSSPAHDTLPKRSTPSADVVERRRAADTALRGASAGGPAGGAWFVKYFDASGKQRIDKWSTSQVLKAIRNDLLDPRTQAAQSSQGPFLPLAQYPLFVHDVEKMLVRYKAKTRQEDLAAQYEKLAKQYERRKWWEMLRRLKESTLGMVGLTLWLCVIGAVGFGIYLVLPLLFNWIAVNVGLKEPPVAEQPASESHDAASPAQRPPTGR